MAMPTPTFYRFEGGPLDGQVIKKTSPARRPLYMDLEGHALDVNKGGRVTNSHWLQRRPKTGPYACYAGRGCVPMADPNHIPHAYTYRYVYTEAYTPQEESQS